MIQEEGMKDFTGTSKILNAVGFLKSLRKQLKLGQIVPKNWIFHSREKKPKAFVDGLAPDLM
ncbi:hypothetical protein FH972_015093 [Carpinus fangiana]|uniref:Formamidopyrimidine-DNA glycosylase-like C-terminal domain-containing protein n=1 Tax=Carpinus fangiana TaxID=176857 RepID=A0A5N6RC16_9ROSI|nr:hypothetical protein FH972_015093 [Carpinus fangiana]